MTTEQTPIAALIAATPAPAPKASNPAGVMKRSNAYYIDPKAIVDDGDHNARFDLGDINELAEQIRVVLEQDPASGGLLNDIRVKRVGDKFQIIDGRRRNAAIQLLLKKGVEFPVGVPAKIVEKNQSRITSIQQQYIANGGKSFLPLEEAATFKTLKDEGCTLKEIADIVGRKQMHISQMLALIDADDSVKEALASGKIGKTDAKEIASAAKGDKEKQRALVAQAAAVGKNKKDKGGRRAVKEAIQQTKAAKAAKKGKVLKMRALSDDQLKEIGEKVAKHLSVLMKEAGIKGEGGAAITEDELRAWVAKDEKLAVAFAFGALQATKKAAGLPVELEI